MSDEAARRAEWRTTGTWFGPPHRPVLGWLTRPTKGASSAGALILPPLGYEHMTTHRTLRTLAEQLARGGSNALRIDYDGTGDSGGDQWDADRLAAWRQSVALGVEELRRAGCDDISVIGLRFGATLALLEGAQVGAARVVAWAPVVSGRRYVRELRMLGLPAATSPDRPELDGALTLGGFVFTAPTLHDLAGVDLAQLPARPAASVLLIERPDAPPFAKLAEQLTRLGSDVDVRAIDGSQQCLDEPAEYATVPNVIVDEISGWVAAAATHAAARAPRADPAEPEPTCAGLAYDGASIAESVERFGPRDLVGIVGSPAGPSTPRATIVWANSGSEHHIGAGRVWVEFSRRLNRSGYRTIRLDCRGWGESPDDGLAPARPYDAHMADDLRDVAGEIEARGWGPVVLAGLCAGAWMALDIARTRDLGGVIACNPQLYWQPGDPVEAGMTETHERRAGERRHLKRAGRFGLWSFLDVVGARDPAARCLHDVNAHGTPTLLLFAHEDDGLEYLHDRAGRALAREQRSGRMRVVELPGIDHGMHRAWLRHEVSDAILEFLETDVAPAHSVER